MKRNIALFLALSMIFVLIAPMNTSMGKEISFTDVYQAKWAEKYITKMSYRDVVSGYTDNTFKPNNGITQLEAVSMVIRFLGYQEEAESASQLQITEGQEEYKYIENVANWAKGNVLVATKLGLININSQAGFDPKAEATRAWMTKLLIDVFQSHGELTTNNKEVNFSDANKIPDWAYQEIKQAANAEIVTGYPDGTFKPQRTVTRAEMTALLSKAEEYISTKYLKNVIQGHIEVKQSDALIINTGNNQVVKRLVSSDAAIYQDTSIVKFDHLRTGDHIYAIVNDNDQIIFIDFLDSVERKAEEIVGSIYLVDQVKGVVTIETKDGSLLTYKLSSQTAIYKHNYQTNMADLRVLDEVKVTVEDNFVNKIEVTKAYESIKNAEIISINDKQSILTLKYNDGTYDVITVNSTISLMDQHNTSIKFSSLQVGDRISVIYQADQVVAIQLPEYSLEGYLVTGVSSYYIIVKKDTRVEYLYFSSPYNIRIKGYDSALPSDLLVGDKINAKINNTIVTELEVTNRERVHYVFDSVDISAKAIKVSDLYSNQYTYLTYESSLKLYKENTALKSVSNLAQNDRIRATIQDGKLIRIDQAVYSKLEVTEVNQSKKYVKVKNKEGKVITYYYPDNLLVKINNVTSYVSNIIKGDEIELYTIGSQVIEIIK